MNNGISALMVLCSNQTFVSLPPSCPQDAGTYVAGSSQSEDCLFERCTCLRAMHLLAAGPLSSGMSDQNRKDN